MEGIKLYKKISVYRPAVLTKILCGTELWTPYMSHMSPRDLFTVGFPVLIFSHNRIDGIDNFLMEPQIRWDCYFVSMNDNKILRVLMYSQLDNG